MASGFGYWRRQEEPRAEIMNKCQASVQFLILILKDQPLVLRHSSVVLTTRHQVSFLISIQAKGNGFSEPTR